MSRRRTPARAAAPRTGAPAAAAAKNRWTIWILLGLVVLTVAVFAPVRHFDFVELDDPLYVLENPHVAGGLAWDAVAWAFSSVHGGYWIPLVWVSYMADVQRAGMDAGALHATNLLLHVLSTLALFAWLRASTGSDWRSGLVAALFAVHPLHVESVAWITERKDVLSTAFMMLAVWAYVAGLRWRTWVRAMVVPALFAAGLMAKPMLVTLPFVLLLVDVWPLDRLGAAARPPARSIASATATATASGWTSLLVEKIPLFVLAVIASVVAYSAQQGAGAVNSVAQLPIVLRLENACVSYVTYIARMCWPVGLSAFYSLPSSIPPWKAAGAALVLVAVSGLVIRLARRYPYLPVGWFWYLGTLVPVIGLVQVGLQSMADRFTYVPLIGVFIIVAWGSADLAARWPIARRALPVAGAAAVVAFAIAARVQLAYWQDSVTLWTRATEITLGVDTYQAHMSLGGVLRAEGRLAEADAHYAEASTLRPSSADARHQLGLVRGVQGRLSDAAVLLAEAARLAPADAQIRADLGFAYAGLGRSEEATAEYQASLRLNPDQARLHNNLGALLADRGRMQEALVHFAEAVRLDPASDQWRVNLGQALARTGRAAEALVQFREALRLNPGHAVARRAVEALATTPAK